MLQGTQQLGGIEPRPINIKASFPLKMIEQFTAVNYPKSSIRTPDDHRQPSRIVGFITSTERHE